MALKNEKITKLTPSSKGEGSFRSNVKKATSKARRLDERAALREERDPEVRHTRGWAD